jgi:methylmalonyl-CoA/ethylmalonyl-CoA epimerase
VQELHLDHVAVAVASIAEAMPLFEGLLGAAGSDSERVEAQGVTVAFVGEGAGRLELIEPLSPDSGVARFLARRGPGIHHLAYRVADLAATLDELAAHGVQLIDRTPRPGAHGHRVAFIHPRSAGGLLVELVEHGTRTEKG